MAVGDAAVELVRADVGWNFWSRPVGVVVEREPATSTAELGRVAGTRHITLGFWSSGGALGQVVAAETLTGPLGAKVWIGAAKAGAFLKRHVVSGERCGGEGATV